MKVDNHYLAVYLSCIAVTLIDIVKLSLLVS